ncbi:hypothetical protein [Streptomyces sp. NPDC017529]
MTGTDLIGTDSTGIDLTRTNLPGGPARSQASRTALPTRP